MEIIRAVSSQNLRAENDLNGVQYVFPAYPYSVIIGEKTNDACTKAMIRVCDNYLDKYMYLRPLGRRASLRNERLMLA